MSSTARLTRLLARSLRLSLEKDIEQLKNWLALRRREFLDFLCSECGSAQRHLCGIAYLTGDEYGWTNIAVDFASGAIGTGIFAKAHTLGKAWKGADKAFRYGRAVGERAEFSHLVKALKVKKRSGLARKIDRALNGVTTRGRTHALTDAERFGFMPKPWKDAYGSQVMRGARKWLHRAPHGRLVVLGVGCNKMIGYSNQTASCTTSRNHLANPQAAHERSEVVELSGQLWRRRCPGLGTDWASGGYPIASCSIAVDRPYSH